MNKTLFILNDAPYGTGTTVEAHIVEVEISNVVVGTPRKAESPIQISWDAVWDFVDSGSGCLPSFITSDSKVILVDGSETTLSSSEDQPYGSGSYTWTPEGVYSSIQVKVEDLNRGNSASSALFNVESLIALSISGPSALEEGEQGTWTASVSGEPRLTAMTGTTC